MFMLLLLTASVVAGAGDSNDEVQIAAGISLQGRRSLAEGELGPVESDIGSLTTRRNGRDMIRRSLEEGEGGTGNDAKDAVMCLADVLECPGGLYLERNPEDGCEFGDCPNLSDNEIVNEDGVLTTDVEQEDLVADVANNSSVEMDKQAKVEEGGEGGAIEADKNDGNDKKEVISDSTYVLGTTNGEVENGEESEEGHQPLSKPEEEDQLPSLASYPSPAEGEESGKEGAKDESSPSSTSYYPDNGHHRSAWLAHGFISLSVFGLLVPIAMSTALFRDFIPGWVFMHVGVNILSFAMTFFAVGIAFATMNGTIAAEGGRHMDERHHVAGLLLLLLISFQTANGFLRPPREFITNDENDTTPGAVFRPNANDRGIRPRMFWYLTHVMSGLFIFALGAYQVQSGLGLYAKRFGTADWGSAYIVYICSLAGTILAAKLWMAWKEQNNMKTISELSCPELQMRKGSKFGYSADDLTVAKWETV